MIHFESWSRGDLSNGHEVIYCSLLASSHAIDLLSEQLNRGASRFSQKQGFVRMPASHFRMPRFSLLAKHIANDSPLPIELADKMWPRDFSVGPDACLYVPPPWWRWEDTRSRLSWLKVSDEHVDIDELDKDTPRDIDLFRLRGCLRPAEFRLLRRAIRGLDELGLSVSPTAFQKIEEALDSLRITPDVYNGSLAYLRIHDISNISRLSPSEVVYTAETRQPPPFAESDVPGQSFAEHMSFVLGLPLDYISGFDAAFSLADDEEDSHKVSMIVGRSFASEDYRQGYLDGQACARPSK